MSTINFFHQCFKKIRSHLVELFNNIFSVFKQHYTHFYTHFVFQKREILTSALRALVKNLVKENFYGKRKKIINVLTAFFISHKSDIKTFFRALVSMTLQKNTNNVIRTTAPKFLHKTFHNLFGSYKAEK